MFQLLRSAAMCEIVCSQSIFESWEQDMNCGQGALCTRSVGNERTEGKKYSFTLA